jgi:hypothetical protein
VESLKQLALTARWYTSIMSWLAAMGPLVQSAQAPANCALEKAVCFSVIICPLRVSLIPLPSYAERVLLLPAERPVQIAKG